MKRTRHKGFILLYVVMILSLIGLAMVLLSYSSKIMAFESTTAYLEASSRNLTLSGVAWANHNRERLSQAGDDVIQLDTGELKITRSLCNMNIIKADESDVEIEVIVSCGRGRRELESSRKFTL
jgi:hypothetical protein